MGEADTPTNRVETTRPSKTSRVDGVTRPPASPARPNAEAGRGSGEASITPAEAAPKGGTSESITRAPAPAGVAAKANPRPRAAPVTRTPPAHGGRTGRHRSVRRARLPSSPG